MYKTAYKLLSEEGERGIALKFNTGKKFNIGYSKCHLYQIFGYNQQRKNTLELIQLPDKHRKAVKALLIHQSEGEHRIGMEKSEIK